MRWVHRPTVGLISKPSSLRPRVERGRGARRDGEFRACHDRNWHVDGRGCRPASRPRAGIRRSSRRPTDMPHARGIAAYVGVFALNVSPLRRICSQRTRAARAQLRIGLRRAPRPRSSNHCAPCSACRSARRARSAMPACGTGSARCPMPMRCCAKPGAIARLPNRSERAQGRPCDAARGSRTDCRRIAADRCSTGASAAVEPVIAALA